MSNVGPIWNSDAPKAQGHADFEMDTVSEIEVVASAIWSKTIVLDRQLDVVQHSPRCRAVKLLVEAIEPPNNVSQTECEEVHRSSWGTDRSTIRSLSSGTILEGVAPLATPNRFKLALLTLNCAPSRRTRPHWDCSIEVRLDNGAAHQRACRLISSLTSRHVQVMRIHLHRHPGQRVGFANWHPMVALPDKICRFINCRLWQTSGVALSAKPSGWGPTTWLRLGDGNNAVGVRRRQNNEIEGRLIRSRQPSGFFGSL